MAVFDSSQIRNTFGGDSGQLIRVTRARHGLSQTRLARRVGSHQSAISRLEADEVSPSVETMEMLMHAMGEQLDLSGVPLERNYDPAHRRATAERPPAERLALGIPWNRMAVVSPSPVRGPCPKPKPRSTQSASFVPCRARGRLRADRRARGSDAPGARACPHDEHCRSHSRARSRQSRAARRSPALTWRTRAQPGQEDTEIDAKMLPPSHDLAVHRPRQRY